MLDQGAKAGTTFLPNIFTTHIVDTIEPPVIRPVTASLSDFSFLTLFLLVAIQSRLDSVDFFLIECVLFMAPLTRGQILITPHLSICHMSYLHHRSIFFIHIQIHTQFKWAHSIWSFTNAVLLAFLFYFILFWFFFRCSIEFKFRIFFFLFFNSIFFFLFLRSQFNTCGCIYSWRFIWLGFW